MKFVKSRGDPCCGMWSLREPRDIDDEALYLRVYVRKLLDRMRPHKQAILHVIQQPGYEAEFNIELGVIYSEQSPSDTTIKARDLAEIAEYNADIVIYPY